MRGPVDTARYAVPGRLWLRCVAWNTPAPYAVRAVEQRGARPGYAVLIVTKWTISAWACCCRSRTALQARSIPVQPARATSKRIGRSRAGGFRGLVTAALPGARYRRWPGACHGPGSPG